MKLLATISAGLLFLILGVATFSYSQEPKEEAKPGEAHPGATAPRQEAAPKPAARPQAEPARPPAPNTHEERAPEAHPPQAHPQPERAPEARPPQVREPEAHPQHEPAHQETAPPQRETRPPEPQNRTAAPRPAPTPRPQPEARPAAEPPRSAERREQAPTPEQQRDWDRHRVDNWQGEHRTWRERGGYNGYRIPEERYQTYFGPPHVFRIYQNPVTFYEGYPRFQYGNYWVQVVDPWPNYWASDWFYTDPVYLEYMNDGYYLVNTRDPGVPLAVEIFQY